MPRALITGATGLIGGEIRRALAERYEVVELGRRCSQRGAPHVAWDLRSALPSELPSRIDLVVHAAGSDGRDSLQPARDCFEINTAATARLLDYAADAGARRFIYFSTGSVYAAGPAAASEADPIAPEGHYAASKAAAETLLAGYSAAMETLCLRLFFPYGPGQAPARLIPRIIERIANGRPVPLHGDDGAPAINPLYVADLVEWVKRLVERGATGAYNLAGCEIVTIRQLAEQIGRLLGLPVLFEIGTERVGNRLGATERVRAATLYEPQVALEEGLMRTIQALSPILAGSVHSLKSE